MNLYSASYIIPLSLECSDMGHV